MPDAWCTTLDPARPLRVPAGSRSCCSVCRPRERLGGSARVALASSSARRPARRASKTVQVHRAEPHLAHDQRQRRTRPGRRRRRPREEGRPPCPGRRVPPGPARTRAPIATASTHGPCPRRTCRSSMCPLTSSVAVTLLCRPGPPVTDRPDTVDRELPRPPWCAGAPPRRVPGGSPRPPGPAHGTGWAPCDLHAARADRRVGDGPYRPGGRAWGEAGTGCCSARPARLSTDPPGSRALLSLKHRPLARAHRSRPAGTCSGEAARAQRMTWADVRRSVSPVIGPTADPCRPPRGVRAMTAQFPGTQRADLPGRP